MDPRAGGSHPLDGVSSGCMIAVLMCVCVCFGHASFNSMETKPIGPYGGHYSAGTMIWALWHRHIGRAQQQSPYGTVTLGQAR